jgi:hypothetical protein
LVGAVRDGAVKDLRGRDLAPEAAETLLAARLRDDLSMQDEAADWTARSLVAALATEPPPAPQASEPEPRPAEPEPEHRPEVADPEPPQNEAPVELALPDYGVGAGDPVADEPSRLATPDAGSIGGDLRPEEYVVFHAAVALEPEPLPTTATQSNTRAPRWGLWVGGGLAAAIAIAIVVGVIVTGGEAPTGVSQPPAVTTPSAVAVVSTPTPAATYGPPESVSIYPGGSLSLEDAYREVAGGGTIRLAAGTYRCSSLSIDNVTLVGQGAKRTRVIFPRSAQPGLDISGVGRTVVRAVGFRLAGKPGKNSWDVVSVTGSARAEFSRCRFANGDAGLGIYGGHVAVSNCIISGSFDTGIWVSGKAQVSVIDTVSKGSHQGNGLWAMDSARVDIRGGEFSGNGYSGVVVGKRARVRVSGATVTGNKGNCIYFWGRSTGRIERCRLISGPNDYVCVAVDDTASVNCLKNTCANDRTWGIYYYAKTKGRVSGNNCTRCRWGIGVEDGSRASIGPNNATVVRL